MYYSRLLLMPSKASTTLRKFLRPILRFLGMSTPHGNLNEFPNDQRRRVENWESYLQEHYCKHRSRMAALKVITIGRFKEKAAPEHEYLVAEVLDPDVGRRYVRIERFADFYDTTLAETSSRHSKSSLSSKSSAGVFSKVPAFDRVEEVAAWPITDDDTLRCIEHLNCRGSQMTLLDLAMAAKIVHDQNTHYHLFRRQCYWYADSITGILEQHFPDIKTDVRSSELDADLALEVKLEVHGEHRGTSNGIPIYTRRKKMIEEFHGIFESHRRRTLTVVIILNF
jgi:hypothetical protein